jgi:alpha-glutamyl/putrescinyl thymine pyrophosphorylase clade 1
MDDERQFFYWINERHAIYLSKAAGQPKPWTNDKIFQQYKFTNPFRELDKTTVWMREHLTRPNSNASIEETLFNCCVFRMFGTMEMGEALGWIKQWDPEYVKSLARGRLSMGLKVFTGAYIITNQGLKNPKEEVVCDIFLTPVWKAREQLANCIRETNSLEALHKELGRFAGWGGGGFMAYEVVTDLNHTSAMPEPVDRFTWANAGLNRLHGRPLDKASGVDWNSEMRQLLDIAPKYCDPEVREQVIDMRTIEHSLCEWDKYQRVLLGQGKPRSLYKGI